MSYKQCVFGVQAAAASEEDVLRAICDALEALAADVALPDVYAFMSAEEDAVATGIRLFMLGIADGSGLMVERGLLVDTWFMERELPVLVLGHDDRNGVFYFEDWRRGERRFWLLSDGPKLGGSVARLTVPYPQAGLSPEALDALAARPEDALDGGERAAVMAYETAIQIGLAQRYPEVELPYLDLLFAEEAWHVYSPAGAAMPVLGPRPSNWANVVAFWPEDDDWEDAEIPQRYY